MTILGDIAGGLLEPLELAERALGELIEKAGEVTQVGGAALAEFGDRVQRLANLVDALQAQLRGA